MLNEKSGMLLEVGDKVRMDIEAIGASDLDGVEVTASGKNYWRYMHTHPQQVYTVTKVDDNYGDAPYFLDGYMEGNNWSADELIYVPEAQTLYELIKNMTAREMANDLPWLVKYLTDNALNDYEVEKMLQKPLRGSESDFMPKVGEYVQTPRFCAVRIFQTFSSAKEMKMHGFTEPTHFRGEFEVCGRSIGINHMIFAAAPKEAR